MSQPPVLGTLTSPILGPAGESMWNSMRPLLLEPDDTVAVIESMFFRLTSS